MTGSSASITRALGCWKINPWPKRLKTFTRKAGKLTAVHAWRKSCAKKDAVMDATASPG